MKNNLNLLSFFSIIAIASCGKGAETNPEDPKENAITKVEGYYSGTDSLASKIFYVYQNDTFVVQDDSRLESHNWMVKKDADSLSLIKYPGANYFRSYLIPSLRLVGNYLIDSFRNGGDFEFISFDFDKGKLSHIIERKQKFTIGDSIRYRSIFLYATGKK